MNEELQSTNEELQTINDELGQRTVELNRSTPSWSRSGPGLDGAVVVLDTDLRVLVWNHGAEELWGLREDEVQGKHFLNLDIGLPVDQVLPAIRAAMSGENGTQSTVIEAVNRRGRTVTCRVTCSPLLDDDKTPRGVIVVVVRRTRASSHRPADRSYRLRTHHTTLPPSGWGLTPQARASCSTSQSPRPPSACQSGTTRRSSLGLSSRTAMCSRSPRSSSRSRISVPAGPPRW